ncbi:MAG: malate dehydrogenase [Armatimonadetes bacterium]|nr:malate dehydrogenase [Armatimonadota bacterium]
MKVAIIGGAGRVGSNAAYALQIGGLVRELAIIDVMAEMAEGEALDLRHGASLAASQRIYSGGYEACEGADIVMVTAGLRRKPDESRLDLINRNVALFKTILAEAIRYAWAENAILFVVANPVDILTYLAMRWTDLSASRIIGLGTVLDTTRFRSFLGEYLRVDPTQVNALILGEHGDSMVPIWSSATVNGTPLRSLPNYDEAECRAVFDATKKSGAEVIRLKSGAGYAVGLAIRAVVDAVCLDKKALLPVSSLQSGLFGIKEVALSVPTVVGRGGVEGLVEIALSPEEQSALQNSGRVLKETIASVQDV